jgi:hypothetical protein
MTIEQTVVIPADHHLHSDLEVPTSIPAGKARASLTLTCEEDQQPSPGSGLKSDWVNPLLGLAKKRGAKLTLEHFIEMQQEEIDRENDRRLWTDK